MELEDLPSVAMVVGVDAEPVLRSMRPIKGWFSDAEARLLLNVACCALTELGDGHEVVEVGAYEGRSTVVLDIRRACSTEIPWAQTIGLLFIDGLHDYRSVRGDYDHFAPWVPPGGYVVFHDYSANFPDVVTCVDEIRQQGCFAVRKVEGDLIVLQRTTAGAPT